MIPAVALIGGKSVVERLITELESLDLKVMRVKCTAKSDHAIGNKGESTRWSPNEDTRSATCILKIGTTMLYKKGYVRSLKELYEYILKEPDLILLEGFTHEILEEELVAKVIEVKDRLDYEEKLGKPIGAVLCICSDSPPEQFGENANVINIEKDLKFIVEHIMNFVKEGKEVNNILDKLAGLDCGKCGYSSCLSLAKAIKEEKASIENCIPISLMPKLKCKITINEREVYMQSFVSEIIRKSILGMLSTLKGVEVEGNESVEVKVRQ